MMIPVTFARVSVVANTVDIAIPEAIEMRSAVKGSLTAMDAATVTAVIRPV
jgi:hypothetical protein